MFTDFIFHCKIKLVFCVLDIFYTLRRVNIWHVLWAAVEAVAAEAEVQAAEAEVQAAEVQAAEAVQAEAVQWEQAEVVQAVPLVQVTRGEARREAQEGATADKFPAATR